MLVSSDFRPVPLARGICTDMQLEWEAGARQVLPRAAGIAQFGCDFEVFALTRIGG